VHLILRGDVNDQELTTVIDTSYVLVAAGIYCSTM
jgi:predicted DNA-binding protein (MmcQ/YjbR family)